MTFITSIAVNAQQISFASKQFESGVKIHLGLDSTAVVLQSQTDTITSIDLSGLDINDIRDVAYLPNVKSLNLSYNGITDISPVVSLDSLHYLDLRANKLEDIDMLTYASSDSMVVDVAFNYITDFGRMSLPSHCRFSFVGRFAQIDLSLPFLNVYQFFAGFEGDRQCVYYRALSNRPVKVVCDRWSSNANADGEWRTLSVPNSVKTTSKVYLTDGTHNDSTWIVPARRFTTTGGQTITIPTNLPENYTTGYVNVTHGTALVSDQMVVTYTTPAAAVPDTISFPYYERNVFRGRVRYYLNCPLPGDVDGDGRVNIDDLAVLIDYLLTGKSDDVNLSNADCYVDGRINVDDLAVLIDYLLTGSW